MTTDHVHITLGIILAFLPSFCWLLFWYKKDYREPEPRRMIALAFVFGMLAVIPLLGLRWQLEHSSQLIYLWNIFARNIPLLPILLVAVLVAYLEESLKHFAALQLGKRLHIEFNQIVDGVVYSISAALGFAFAENIFYFIQLLDIYALADTELWTVIGFRAFGTTLGHSLFSGIFGLFWGHAFLSKTVTPRHSHSVSHFFKRFFKTLRFHIIFKHILKNRPSLHGHEKSSLVREALLFAALIHALFNILIAINLFGTTLTPLVVPLLFGGLLFLSHQFYIKRNIHILHPVAKKDQTHTAVTA